MLKLYPEESVQAIADAIREKNGSTDKYKIGEMADAIGGIQGGWSTDGIAKHKEPNGNIIFGYSGTIEKSSFYGCVGITKVAGNNITKINDSVFEGCTGMLQAVFPNVTNIGISAFKGCSNVESIDIRNAIKIDGSAFEKCYKLASFIGGLTKVTTLATNAFMNTDLSIIVLPALTGDVNGQVFLGCPNLEAVDIGVGATQLRNQYHFKDCTSLRTLILRHSDSIITIGNNNAFTNTPFADGGSGGTLYVPNDLISSYQSASNWSTILGYANNQIKAIEGSIYETQYADGTPISS